MSDEGAPLAVAWAQDFTTGDGGAAAEAKVRQSWRPA
jgi:hypothetical protein